jgi:DNA-binding transcriptional MerR regulator
MKDFLSIGQVAQETGIPTYRIKYAIENLKIPGPSERFGNLRVFTKKDVEKIRRHFEALRPCGQPSPTPGAKR